MNTCKQCGETVEVPDDLEHTGHCNICAQQDALRLDWLNKQRDHVRGTDFPLWKLEGSVEDGRRAKPQNIRQAIDLRMGREITDDDDDDREPDDL